MTTTHSLSPYPSNVRLKPIADGCQIFQDDHYRGEVEQVNDWGVKWRARPHRGEVRTFTAKQDAVRYVLIDVEDRP